MSLKNEIQQALDACGLAPNKRFGQHFMIDLASVQALVASLELGPESHVVEIGPGTGILTKRLLETGAQTLACEIDAGMVSWLQQYLVPEGLQLVHGDALRVRPSCTLKSKPLLVTSPGAWVRTCPTISAFPCSLTA